MNTPQLHISQLIKISMLALLLSVFACNEKDVEPKQTHT